MASLPDGMYTIVLKDGDITHTQEIKKSIDQVYVVSIKSETLLTPETALIKRKLVIAYPEAVSKVEKVSFRGKDGNVFFQDDVAAYTGAFKKGYVVNDLPEGMYTVAISTSQDTFYKQMTLGRK